MRKIFHLRSIIKTIKRVQYEERGRLRESFLSEFYELTLVCIIQFSPIASSNVDINLIIKKLKMLVVTLLIIILKYFFDDPLPTYD